MKEILSVLSLALILSACSNSAPSSSADTPGLASNEPESPQLAPTSSGLGNFGILISNEPHIVAANSNIDADGVLKFDICLDLPSDADWVFWMPVASANGFTVSEYGYETIESRSPVKDGRQQVTRFDGPNMSVSEEPMEGSVFGRRCFRFTFSLPAGTTQERVSVTFPGILARPLEGEECQQASIARMQDALRALDLQITVECNSQPGYGGLHAVQWPTSLTEEQANAVLASTDVLMAAYGYSGPWTVTFPLPSG